MIKTFCAKCLDNLASLKLWVFGVATYLLGVGKISEYTWAGIAATIIGGRIFEYFANGKKNGNGDSKPTP